MGFWVTLWKDPRRAFRLGGLALLLGFGLGGLGMWEKNDTQARFGCVLGAAFCFALWSLLSSVGAMATYAAAAQRAFTAHGRGPAEPRDERPAEPGAAPDRDRG